jgi:hypothetical protein
MVALRRLAVAATGAALFALLAGPAARAVAPSAHGYWWKLQRGTGPALPPPPFVPSSGLWIAADPSGQQAISAIRYKAAADDEIRELVLTVSQSSGQGSILLACNARSAWTPAEAGVWTDRPDSSCNVAHVKGVESGDGLTWTFDVRGLARSGELDVVILPPGDVDTTFSISFESPDSSSIRTRRFPGGSSPSSFPRSGTPGSGASSSPARVLSEKTNAPRSSASSSGIPSGSPSGTSNPRALEPFARAGRAVWPIALAAVLVLAVFRGRAVLKRR